MEAILIWRWALISDISKCIQELKRWLCSPIWVCQLHTGRLFFNWVLKLMSASPNIMVIWYFWTNHQFVEKEVPCWVLHCPYPNWFFIPLRWCPLSSTSKTNVRIQILVLRALINMKRTSKKITKWWRN